MPAAGRHETGFTLMELMAVLVIMGVMAAVSYGALNSSLPQARLEQAGQALTGDIWSARQRAITDGNNHVITFDVIQRRYEVWDDEGSDGHQSPGEEVVLVDLPIGVSINSVSFGGGNRLTLKPDGSAASGGTVILRNPRGHSARVEVIRATGKVKHSLSQ